jgi:hypothetical protein
MPEELSLNLDQTEAASLYLLLEMAIDSLSYKRKILDDVFALPKEQRPPELMENETLQGVINLNTDLIDRAKEFCSEVGQIILELEKPEPTIIPHPNWKK